MLQFERTRHGIAGFAASDADRRHAGAIEFGKVHEADYDKRRLKVLIGDENDEDGHVITGWLPMPGLRAQNDSDWHPLEVGERVAVLSASGELQNGLVLPAGIFCDDNPAPGNKPGLWIRLFKDGGKLTYDRDTGEWLLLGMSKITLQVGGCKLDITDEGFAFTGGTVTHDGVNIGKDHTHTQVEPGAGISGPPQP